MTVVWLGLGLTGAVTAILTLTFGVEAFWPSVSFGLLATAIQVVAVALVRPVLKAPLRDLMWRWGVGMALRLSGVVLFVVAVLLRPDIFPPLPTAFAYIGVLVPLLFTEIRLFR